MSRAGHLNAYLLGIACLVVLANPALQAGELAPCFETPSPASPSAPVPILHPAASVAALSAPVSGLTGVGELMAFPDGAKTRSLLQPSARRQYTGRVNEYMFLRARMPSRYAYESWAGVHAGYGQFFPDDKIGRVRTSGVGLQDPDWLFMKISFRF